MQWSSPFFQLVVQQTLTLMALIDPIVLIPVFLTMTQGHSPDLQRRFTQRLALFVLAILLGAAYVGPLLFSLLGLSLSSLQIAGSIVLFTMGIAMLMGQQVFINSQGSHQDMTEPSLVPLAIPLLAGPASISYVMTSHAQPASSWATPLACLLASLFVFLTFVCAPRLRSIKQSYLAIIERLAGLLVMVIAIDSFTQALKTIFPLLRSTP